MSYPNPSTALAATLVDELVRGGVGLIVAAPGSRSTALVLAAASRSDIGLVMAVDERSAGFQAVGWAKASGKPSAVITTSGTAVANLMPAVVEADASGVPLLVLSSDRPPESRRVGANQTIEQLGLFGGFVRLTVDLGPAEVDAQAPRWWRSMVSQALGAAMGWNGRRGPVQIDVSFREPTVGVPDDGRTAAEPFAFDEPGRPDGRHWTEALATRQPSVELVGRLGDAIGRASRGLIMAGAGTAGSRSVAELGAHLGWPVVATAESGIRGPEGVISTGHHLLASEESLPDLVIRFGAPGPSRRLIDLIAGPVPQVVVGPVWSDPGRMADLVVDVDASGLADALIESLPERKDGWVGWWKQADRAVRQALEPELATALTEPGVAVQVARLGAASLVVGSSMPIRDVESYAFDVPSIIANRGASGIDGIVSTALGAAQVSKPVVALVGDLSFLHDSNGFLCEPRPDCVFVVVDNSGGGIFSFLPQADHVGADFERLFATPPNRDLSVLADFHHLDHSQVEDSADLAPSVKRMQAAGGCGLVVVKTDRVDNVHEHRRLERVALDAIASI